MDTFLTGFPKRHFCVHSASQKMAPEDQALNHPWSSMYTLTLSSALCISTEKKGNLEGGTQCTRGSEMYKYKCIWKTFSKQEEHGDGVLKKKVFLLQLFLHGRLLYLLMVQSYRINIGPTAEPGTVHMAQVLKEWQGHWGFQQNF